MSNSALVTYTRWSPNYDSREGHAITDITIHHMAGNLTVYQCGEVFQTRPASAHYGIDSEGQIGQYVDEKYAAWANGNHASNIRSVTIELANDQIGGNWHVSDTAIEKCIDLCADICRRNGITINYTGDTSGNLTMHRWFMSTSCPGDYLASKFPYIAKEISRRMKNGWIQDGKDWYYYKDGKLVKNGWAQDKAGLWYWLGSDGKMVTSNMIEWKGNKYYLKASGAMASNEWIKFANGWRWFAKDGRMIKAKWIRYKNNMYYLKEDGYMATGSMTVPCKFNKTDGKLEASV